MANSINSKAYTECVITGSISRSATRRYLSYSEADFAPMGMKFGTAEGTAVPNFTPIGATIRV